MSLKRFTKNNCLRCLLLMFFNHTGNPLKTLQGISFHCYPFKFQANIFLFRSYINNDRVYHPTCLPQERPVLHFNRGSESQHRDTRRNERKSFTLTKASLNGCFFFPLLLTETSPLQKDSKANHIYVQCL